MTKESGKTKLPAQAVIGHLDFVIDSSLVIPIFVIDPARDWLPGEGPCEIQLVGAPLPPAGPPRVPAARDSDLHCSQGVQRPTQLEQETRFLS